MQLGLHKEHRKKGEEAIPCWDKATVWACPREKQPCPRATGEERAEGGGCSRKWRRPEENNKLNYRKIGRKRICCRRECWNLRRWISQKRGVKEERGRENPEGTQRRVKFISGAGSKNRRIGKAAERAQGGTWGTKRKINKRKRWMENLRVPFVHEPGECSRVCGICLMLGH